jgi:hypothetical protein
MKNLLTIVIVTIWATLMSLTSFAQTAYISCSERTLVKSVDKGDFEVIKTESQNSIFEITQNQILHTTPSMKSAYYIERFKKEEQPNIYEMYVMSDVGNLYLVVVDLVKNEVRFFYIIDNTTYVVVYKIKKYW